MTSWRACKSHLISTEDTTELMRLAKIDAEEIAKTDRWHSLAKVMRVECPVPGNDWHKLLVVWKPIGGEVPDHAHREHVMLFYPQACDPILIEGVPFYPDKGAILHINPWTHHNVPSVTTERLTIAMLVKDAETSSSE